MPALTAMQRLCARSAAACAHTHAQLGCQHHAALNRLLVLPAPVPFAFGAGRGPRAARRLATAPRSVKVRRRRRHWYSSDRRHLV